MHHLAQAEEQGACLYIVEQVRQAGLPGCFAAGHFLQQHCLQRLLFVCRHLDLQAHMRTVNGLGFGAQSFTLQTLQTI